MGKMDTIRVDFPGGLVVKTLSFHRRDCGFDFWLGNKDFT